MDRDIRRLLRPVLLLLLLMVLSTEVFYLIGICQGRDNTLLECLYMVTITISTVGYEDVLHTRDSLAMTIFNIVAIPVYMVAVAYAISNFTAFLIEGRLNRHFQHKRIYKRIKKMQNHYIVCGIADIGSFAAQELHETERSFVVIEKDKATIDSLAHQLGEFAYIVGDATDDDTLGQAGIDRARAVMACMENDKDNLYLVLAAKELNGDVQIAARFNSPKAYRKLLHAGATHLISPYRIGGLRMASELIRPQVVSFLERMMRDRSDRGIRVEEFVVPETAKMIGHTLGDLHKQTGVLVISYRHKDHEDFQYNPNPHEKIQSGMGLVFIGSPQKREKLEESLSI